MTSSVRLAAAAAICAALVAGPALASPCGDRIATLERRLDEGAAAAGAASSGGQAVAAAREGQAMQGGGPDRGAPAAGSASAPTMPFQSEAREAQATRRAAEAGAGGDRIVQARATLNRARTLDGRGEAAACMDAVAEAERQLASSP